MDILSRFSKVICGAMPIEAEIAGSREMSEPEVDTRTAAIALSQLAAIGRKKIPAKQRSAFARNAAVARWDAVRRKAKAKAKR